MKRFFLLLTIQSLNMKVGVCGSELHPSWRRFACFNQLALLFYSIYLYRLHDPERRKYSPSYIYLLVVPPAPAGPFPYLVPVPHIITGFSSRSPTSPYLQQRECSVCYLLLKSIVCTSMHLQLVCLQLLATHGKCSVTVPVPYWYA